MRLLVAAALAVGLGSSCVKEDGAVFIQGVVPLDDECIAVAARAGQIFSASGLLDVLDPRGFTAALQVVTNLPSTFSNADLTQSKTQSPNFQGYGPTDNNIIIFEKAEVDFEFQVANDDDVAAVEAVEIAGSPVFSCSGTVCTAKGQQPAVSGAVFNEGQTLSTPAIVFLEAMSATDADAFEQAFEQVLKFPDDRARIIVNMRLQGTTTGNGDIRPITTFGFPFPIDLCRGCIIPNADLCEDVDATLNDVATPPVACFIGQDTGPFATCNCEDGALVGREACP